jgi:hypothetical protein
MDRTSNGTKPLMDRTSNGPNLQWTIPLIDRTPNGTKPLMGPNL